MPFSCLAPSKQKILFKKLRVGYVYIKESFDTILNMGYGGGVRTTPPPPHGFWGGPNSPWTKGVYTPLSRLPAPWLCAERGKLAAEHRDAFTAQVLGIR